MTVFELPQKNYGLVVFAHLQPIERTSISMLSWSLFGYDVPLVIGQGVRPCRCPVERETRTHVVPSPGAESAETRVDPSLRAENTFEFRLERLEENKSW
jgi:hypothetical protein